MSIIWGHYQNIHSKCNDWRIEVFSNGGIISGIREYGIFRISGSLSNVVELPEDRKMNTVYTWKSGKNNVCIRKEPLPSICKPFLTYTDRYCNIDDPEGCYPYGGNFRIAFKWKKDSTLCQYTIIILTLLALIKLIDSFFL